jgi:hypothetical protein
MTDFGTGGEVDFHAWHATISSPKRASFLNSPPVPGAAISCLKFAFTIIVTPFKELGIRI